jgi:hypothetical protein
VGVLGFAREDDFDSLIWSAAGRYGVDPAAVKATVAIESAFDPDAYRAEPAVGDASVGLMQTLLRTARGLGYPGDYDGLRDPGTSIEYGTAYLAQQGARYGWTDGAAYAAYNAGSARRDSQGYFVNSQGSRAVQARVNTWLRYWTAYREASATPGTAPGPLVGGGAVVPDILRDIVGSPEGTPGGGAAPPAAASDPLAALWEWWAPTPEPAASEPAAPVSVWEEWFGPAPAADGAAAPEPTTQDAATVETLLASLGFPAEAPAGENSGSWVPLALLGAAFVGLVLFLD